ncbi:PadR family transcriptional regulator [uncultured Neglectibacter sp.]|uniref:PadR family transcriptional regulator n=1 Tax=uncultured Neglectibacter sp. TaxID=1924108 RepID=UPI0034DE1020
MLSEREAAEFKRGPLQMMTLFLLKQRDMYAYQISQEMYRLSEGKFSVAESSFYILLYRLVDKGYISKQKETGVKKPRTFYHLEPSGEDFLTDLMLTYTTMCDGIAKVFDSIFSERAGGASHE